MSGPAAPTVAHHVALSPVLAARRRGIDDVPRRRLSPRVRGPIEATTYVAVIGALAVAFAVSGAPTWVVYVVSAAVVGSAGAFVTYRMTAQPHRARARTEAFLTTHEWTVADDLGRRDLKVPDRKPFGTGLDWVADGALSAIVDGWRVVSYGHGVVRRASTEHGGLRTTTEVWHVVLVRLPDPLPFVEVRPANRLDRVRKDITVGVGEFDRAFRVTSDEPAFVTRVVGPDLATALLSGDVRAAAGWGTWRIHGTALMWFRPGAPDTDVLPGVARLLVTIAPHLALRRRAR